MILALLLLPLSGGALALLVRPAHARRLGLLTLALTFGSAVAAAFQLGSGPSTLAGGGWAPPLGIRLRLDGLAATMIVMTTAVAIPVAAYATGYFDDRPAGQHAAEGSPEWAFWPVLLLLTAALNGLFLTGDLFNAYVALELVTLAAIALMVVNADATALRAAMRYLLAAFLGSLAYLLGVAILYARFGALDFAVVGAGMVAEPATWSALALVSAGLALKTALFPLHFWLPGAHSSAAPPVSALLSSLVVTGSFYLFLRLWSTVFPGVLRLPLTTMIGVLGALAIVWGSVMAIRQQRLKLLIAYSTVAQVGYLFLAAPLIFGTLGSAASEQAWNGGIYHALSHAFAKAAMFLAAGSIARSLGHDRIVGISGIATHLPISTYAFGVAGMSLIGLPPSGGFISKWLLLSSAIGQGQWWWAAVLLLGGLLTAGYVFVVLGQELSEARSDEPGEFRPVPRLMEYSAMALALVSLLLGVRAFELLELIGVGAPMPSVGP